MKLLKYLPLLLFGFLNAQEEVVHSVYFDFDKFTLNETQVKDVIDFIKKTDSTRIESIQIFGYTDDIGKEAYNFKLSTKRATEIQNKFIENGIKSKIIVTIEGKGRILIDDDILDNLGLVLCQHITVSATALIYLGNDIPICIRFDRIFGNAFARTVAIP